MRPPYLVGHGVVHGQVDVPARGPLDVGGSPHDVVSEEHATNFHLKKTEETEDETKDER